METTFECRIDPHGRNDLQGIQYPLPQLRTEFLGGGMVYEKSLTDQIRSTCEYIAPVFAYPGEFEMEAMAAGAVRVLSGEEEGKHYTGRPVFSGFEF